MRHGQSEKRRIPILMYHSISSTATAQFKPFAVSPASFAEQMEYLDQHGYTPITVTQLIHARTHGTLPEQPVVLTFDDGFADFFTYALPVFKKHNFVATLYITTSFVGDTSRWLWREGEAARPMLTWEQIQEIDACNIECGGHTHTHPQLDLIPISAARAEIVQNKQLLESHLGHPIFSFAYPHGYHSIMVQRAVREVGYTSACAVKYEMAVATANPFRLARLLVSDETNLSEFAALLNSPSPSVITRVYKRARVPLGRIIRYSSNKLAQPSPSGV